eukprot:jgi/Mesen1/862/ME000114S10943
MAFFYTRDELEEAKSHVAEKRRLSLRPLHEVDEEVGHYSCERIVDYPPEKAIQELDSNAKPTDRVERVIENLPAHVPSTSGAVSSGAFRYWRVRDYAHAYKSGDLTPSQRVILAAEEAKRRKPTMNFFISMDLRDIRKQAADSTQRHEEGKPLSALDGVPVAVKDEIDCLPYSTTGGSRFVGLQRPVTQDAECVKKLRECGAIIIGKTNMHELGNGVLGTNLHYGTARNPHNPDHYTGGSSSGSAAVVAAGICPIALGVDAGGSIRIPASLCGVLGLKGTFNRVDPAGCLPFTWSLGSVGPITTCAEDALIAYAAILGADTKTVNVSSPLPPAIPLFKESIMGSVKLGIFEEWFVDSAKDVYDINIPELQELQVGHVVTLGSEMAQGVQWDYEHGRLKDMGWDIRLNFLIFRAFTGRDYVTAQRLRARAMHHHLHVLEAVDVIVTPTTAQTAPLIRADAVASGESDLTMSGNLIRFILAGNFVGLPAVSVPIGYDQNGLPIGLQLIGRPWQEATLLHVAASIEALVQPQCKRPEVFYDNLHVQ